MSGCGKIPFRTRKEAEKELRRIRLTVRGRKSSHQIPTRVYICTVDDCGCWHLTAQSFRH